MCEFVFYLDIVGIIFLKYQLNVVKFNRYWEQFHIGKDISNLKKGAPQEATIKIEKMG